MHTHGEFTNANTYTYAALLINMETIFTSVHVSYSRNKH